VGLDELRYTGLSGDLGRLAGGEVSVRGGILDLAVEVGRLADEEIDAGRELDRRCEPDPWLVQQS